MPEEIRSFFEDHIGPDAPPIYVDRAAEERRRLDVAACALLVELAHADDEFSDAERSHIETVVQAHFGLLAAGAQELIALAEQERASKDLFQFTSLIREHYDRARKAKLVEILWGLALSDGEIARHESWMMDKLAALIDLSPDELAQAKTRIAPKGITPS